MKTNRFYFIIITLLFTIYSNAQTVTLYTPTGSSVQAIMRTEMSSSDITYYTNLYRVGYPQATILANASTTYNCHSYAWNLSEGGTTICWINQSPDLHKYWDDNSYIETTEANVDKIFYYNGDHSAVKSKTVAGMYESKWGQMPLMRHAPNYGPIDYNMTYRKYYKKSGDLYAITGSSLICNQGSYSINNLPLGAAVSWNSSNTSIATVAGSGSTATLTKVSTGAVILTATVNYSNTTLTIKKDIYLGSPLQPTSMGGVDSNNKKLASNSAYDFYIETPVIQGVNQFVWAIKPGSGTIISGQGTSMITVETADVLNRMSFYVSVKVANACGFSTPLMRTGTIYGGIGTLSIYPNPTTDIVTISLGSAEIESMAIDSTKETTKSTSFLYEVQLWNESANLVKTVEGNQALFQIPLTGLPRGMYYVHFNIKGKTIEKQILWVK